LSLSAPLISTGSGKSTLIRLLVTCLEPSFDQNGTAKSQTQQYPVIGATDFQPTSAGVHLYTDPSTYDGTNPILYADSEGQDPGESAPTMRIRREKGNLKRANEREISWATPTTKHLTDMYPEFLYIFSDVLVFVNRNVRYALCPLPHAVLALTCHAVGKPHAA
jgi:hypothetical protein